MKASIRRLNANDVLLFQQLIRLFATVFGERTEPVSPGYLKALLMNPYCSVYVAMMGDVIAGGATVYELPMYTRQGAEAMIYDIAVAKAFQRQGIGKALLDAIREDCRQQGIREVFVAANEEDAHALDFYRAAGGTAERVRHFTFEVGE